MKEFEIFGQDVRDFQLDDKGILKYIGCRDRPFDVSIKTNIKVLNPKEVCNKGYLSLNTIIGSVDLTDENYGKISDKYSFEGQSRFNRHLTKNSISSSFLLFIRPNNTIFIGVKIDEIYKIDDDSILEIEVVISLLGSLTSYIPRPGSVVDCLICSFICRTPPDCEKCYESCV